MNPKRKKSKKESSEKKINPNSFYEKMDGVYNHPKKDINIKIKRSSEEIHKRREAEKIIKQEEKPIETIPPEFDQEQYKEEEPKIFNPDVMAHKSSHQALLVLLIGVLVIFGLFFVWSVSTDKFKTDFTCPDCECPQAQLSCPNIDISQIKQPACICNQTCPEFNDTEILDAISNLNISNSSG